MNTRRVDFLSHAEDFESVLMLAMGISPRVVAHQVGFGNRVGKVTYRGNKANVRCTDFRMMRKNTIGGQVAQTLVSNGVHQKLEAMMRRHIQNEMPTKKDAKRGAGRTTVQIAGAR